MALARPCLLCLLMVALATATRPNSDPEWIAHIQHVEAFRARCGTPRPAAIHIGEFVKGYGSNGKRYSPDMTVLHRCDPGVCCCSVRSDSCVAAHIQKVTVVFLAVYTIDVEGHGRGQQVLERYSADNHTRCVCFNQPP